MNSHWGTHTRKRKRRRGPDCDPISAQLVLDGRLKGDVGLLSEDLFVDLFPSLPPPQDTKQTASGQNDVCFVAITPPQHPSATGRDFPIPWTILAVDRSSTVPPQQQPSTSALYFSAESNALQSFIRNLQKTSANISRLALQAATEIQIIDVVPLALQTVVVGVDVEGVVKLEQANRRFHKGQQVVDGTLPIATKANRQKKRKAASQLQLEGSLGDRFQDVVRRALAVNRVTHAGDLLPLPIHPHPITHVPPPPAILEFCEPVSQGIVVANTRIVIVPKGAPARLPTSAAVSHALTVPNGTAQEEDEDTSNEQFYSAAEDSRNSPASKKNDSGVDSSDAASDDDTATSNDDSDLSDDDAGTLGLTLPTLPAHAPGTFSSLTAATPRAANLFNDGIGSPGSVMSGFSMSTVLGGGSKGKLFEVQGLTAPIPTDILHPKTSSEEDPEIRAFVDTSLLAKIGCFSGDWIRVEASLDEGLNGLGSWGLTAMDEADGEPSEWRILKLYALPGQSSRRLRYAINKGTTSRHHRSFSALLDKSAPKVFISPITLANLGNPKNVRISTLPFSRGRRSSRLASSSSGSSDGPNPPVAESICLKRHATAISFEKSLSAGIVWGLETYFKRKQRLVKPGDLIAFPIEETLSRAVHQAGGAEEDPITKEILSMDDQKGVGQNRHFKTNAAWYRVASVQTENEPEDSPWGTQALVKTGDPTQISQIGDEHGKLPDTMHNPWQYYMGIKRLPPLSTSDPTEDNQVGRRPPVHVSPTRRRLREILSVATSPQAIHLGLASIAILLTSTHRHIGKAQVAKDACADLGLHCYPLDAYDILSEGGSGGGDVNTASLLESRAERGLLAKPEHTALLLRHVDILTAERMIVTVRDIIAKSRVFVATTTAVDKVAEGMRNLFTHEIEIPAPDEREREALLQSMVQDLPYPLSSDVDLNSIAVKTAALVAGDLLDVTSRAAIARRERLQNLVHTSKAHTSENPTVHDILVSGGEAAHAITSADFQAAVEAARKNFADAIGAPKIPNVSWSDVGGLSHVKSAVLETIQLPLERPELFAKGMKKRSGILFYGPPGTGKTLLAKAIATEFSLNFFSVKGPELLNMYIGESEANVRRVFQRARDARPCVIFFDELDSVAPKRGNQGDSGGVMDRIVSQLLAELDGMNSSPSSSSEAASGGSSGVFIIAATNRPDLLDQALLRPGRFDKMLYLGVPDTHAKQLTILEALTRKFALDPACDLSRVAASLPLTYTGADLYALCSDAMLKGVMRKAEGVRRKVEGINFERRQSARSISASGDAPDGPGQGEKTARKKPLTIPAFFDHLATEADVNVVVSEGDFLAARDELVASVSRRELMHYERVRRAFEGKERDDADVVGGMGDLSIGGVNGGVGAGKATDIVGEKGKEKGKAKARAKVEDGVPGAFGDAAAGDEAMYD